MKANLKGLSGIKGLLLRHGEKFGIGAVALVAAYIVYSSLGLQPLSDQYQANVLSQKIQSTRATVTQRSWNEALQENPDAVRVPQPVAKRDFSVDPSAYAPTTPHGFSRAVIPPTIPRTDPVLLSAVDLEVTSGVSLFAFMDESVQRARALKAQAEEQRRQKELEKQQQQQAQGQARGRVGGGEGYGAYGMDASGMMVDPEHPNRRPVEFMAGPATGPQLMGDERIDKVHWACIVAKIPIKEQLKLYKDAFENTRTGMLESDFPQYLGYFIERAEVIPGQELNWQRVQVHDAQSKRTVVGPAMMQQTMEKLYAIIAKEWAGGQPMEVVDPRYMPPGGGMVYPLPPVIGREWGSEITHSEIPLAVDAPPMEMEMMPEETLPKTPANMSEEAMFSAGNQNMQGGMGYGMREGGGAYGGGGGYGRVGAPGRGMGEGGGYGGGYGGGGGYGRVGAPGRGMGGGGYGMGGPGMMMGAAPGTLPKGVSDWLLRFFDFTVEPGKKYKYRVRLVMDDPNRNPNLPPKALDSTVLDRIREAAVAAKKIDPKRRAPTIRYTEWSDASPTVGIPLAGSVHVAEAKAPSGKGFNEAPVGKLMVTSIDMVEGKPMQTSIEKELERGTVANFVEKRTPYVTIDGRWIDQAETFNFTTGITVLDIKGGEELARDQSAPARILLMDPTGQLYVRGEIKDLPVVERQRALLKEPDRRNPGGRGDMPYGEGGGRGYGGYGEGGGGPVGRPVR